MTAGGGERDPVWLAAADVQTDAAGRPTSARYGDVYASRAGALGQARAVFLAGCGLLADPPAWAARKQYTVLENGFGLGVNFLATWAAWRADPLRPARLHYVAIERHPVRPADLLAFAPAELQDQAAELAAQWPLPLAGLHPLRFESGAVRLLLALGDARQLAPQLRLQADALFLDGFAPSRNPEMWSPELLRALARLCRPGARAASYTVARAVRDSLSAAGFTVERAPGWGGKRERLQAVYAPRWARSPATAASVPEEPSRAAAGTAVALPNALLAPAREVVIVGAGLAGAACAQALAARGWRVTVLEAAAQPASGGSAMPAGLAHLQLSADDNVLSRLTRAGLAALRAALPPDPALAVPGGVLLTAADPAEAQRLQAWRQTLRLPPAHARWLDAAEATAWLGVPTPPGWWVDGLALANAPLCRAWLAQPGVRLRTGATVARIVRTGDLWQALDAAGQPLAQAPWLILANALQAPALLAASHLLPVPDWLPLQAWRGQAHSLPAAALPALAALRHGWMGAGYALPLPAAAAPDHRPWALIGASYEPVQSPWSPAQAWAHNRAGVAALLGEGLDTAPLAAPMVSAAPALEVRTHAGVRAVPPDRLPYVGALPDFAALVAAAPPAAPGHPWAGRRAHELPRLPGLLLCVGMASRGLTLAALAAEVLAAQMDAEPAPLTADLLAALDPARAVLRRLRKVAAAVSTPPPR